MLSQFGVKGEHAIMGKTLRWLVVLAFVLSLSCIVSPAYGQNGDEPEEETVGEEPVEEEAGTEAGEDDETLIEEEDLTAEEIAAEAETDRALEAQISAENAAREADSAVANDDYDLAVAKLKEAVELAPDEEKYLTRLKEVQKAYIYNLLKAEEYPETITQADDFLARFTDEDDTDVRQVKSFREIAASLLETGPTEPTTEALVEEFAPEARTDSELLAEAISAYRKKDYDLARELLLEVRELNKYNVEVDRWIDRVNYQVYRHERSIRETTRQKLVIDVIDAWNRRPRRPRIEAGPIEPPGPEPISEPRKLIIDKLETIIPEVNFEDAELEEVIDFLAREADVNIVIDPIVFQTMGPLTTTPPIGPDFPPDDEFPPDGERDFDFPEEPVDSEEPGEEFAPQGSMGPGGMGGPVAPPPGFGPDTGFPPPGTGFGPDLGTGPSVPGYTPTSTKITIRLTNVPLKEVLKYVLRYKSLKYVVEDYAILIIPINYELPEDLVTEIFRLSTSGVGTTPMAGTPTFGGTGDTGGTGGTFGGGGFDEFGGGFEDTATTTGQPQNIEEWLKRAGGVTWPTNSDVFYHQPTATLIVVNTPTNMVLIRELIKIWDRPPMQVEVEARFVELVYDRNFENSFKIGMTDALRFTRNEGRNFGTLPLRSRERVEMTLLPAAASNKLRIGSETSLDSPLLDISGILTRPEFQLVWYALNQNKYTDLLSAPRVTTISGQQALIQLVQEIRYPTEYETESLEDVVGVSEGLQTFYVTPGTFETREVGVRLNVTPTVSSDGEVITLVLLPEVSELVSWINYGTERIPAWQPVFEARNVTTTVYINDGETLVLGGVIKDNTTNVSDRVPFLGSIPLLGRFFRSEYEVADKRNLVIFVSADLITSRGTRVKQERELTGQRQRYLELYRRQIEAEEEEGTTIPLSL